MTLRSQFMNSGEKKSHGIGAQARLLCSVAETMRNNLICKSGVSKFFYYVD